METRLTAGVMEALSQPFGARDISFKPGAVTKDGSKALALAYADARVYQDRLNQVLGADWSDDYQVSCIASKVIVTCRLTVAGVTRTDVGECDASDSNAATSAASQALKRAATRFQVGRYLYSHPSRWMPYDEQRRKFTPEALEQLQRMVPTGNGAGRSGNNGDLVVPSGKHAGKPLTWLLEHDRGYLERVATGANDAELREAARALLN